MSPGAVEPLALIAAVGRGRVIGSSVGRLGLPWHLPEDLRHFKRTTTGHSVIMGRKTFDAIGRALPGRVNVVLTRDAGWSAPDVMTASSLEAAIAFARGSGDDLPFVIGGASVYGQALPLASDLYLTEVDRDAEGDAFFPELDESAFEEVERRAGDTEGVVFRHLRRRT